MFQMLTCRYRCTATVALLALLSAASPPPAGKIDDEILKPVIEEARLNFLAGRIADLMIHLPPDKAFGFTNSNKVDEAAGRVARGMESRQKFLAEAPKLLAKRRKEVEQVIGEKLPEAQELVKQPHNQAEVFVLMLTHAVRQMHLPPGQDKPRMLLGKRLQALYDEDARRRSGRDVPQRDEAWLKQYQADTQQDLFELLKPDEQKEVIRVWPILFPDGPSAPPT